MYRLICAISIFFFTLALASSAFAIFNSNPDLPPPNAYGDPCLSYSPDGCNICYPDGGCTQKLCGCSSGEKGDECREKLKSRALTCLKYGLSRRSAKQVPPLEGKHLGTCLRALLPKQICEVNTTSDYKWSCRNLENPIPEAFDAPLCIENGKGRPINGKEFDKLLKTAAFYTDLAGLHQRFQTEAFCMKWEDHCSYRLNNYYPPQTKFYAITEHGPTYTSRGHAIYTGQDNVTCQQSAQGKPRKNECKLQLTFKDFPPIDLAPQDSTLAKYSIEKEARCVRYDNKCHNTYLALDEYPKGSGKLIWRWFPDYKSSCSLQERQDTLNKTMTCTSHYKEYPTISIE